MERDRLLEDLQNEILSTTGLVVIQAGHFAVLHDINNQLIPGVYQDIEDEKISASVRKHPYMGHFPLETWNMGVELLNFALKNSRNSKMLIIVNDWQFVKKAELGKENYHRKRFYKNSKLLPNSFQSILKNYGLTREVILPFKKRDGKIIHSLFFSESKLRKRFRNYHAKTCSLGSHQCAQEYVPLLSQVSSEEASLFISFVPETCRIPVNAGSNEAKLKYNLEDLKIINVFSNGTYKNYFWENSKYSII